MSGILKMSNPKYPWKYRKDDRVYYVSFTRLNCFNVAALIKIWGVGVWRVVVAGEKRLIFVQGPKNRGWGVKEFSLLDWLRLEQLFRPLPGHLGIRFLTRNPIKNEASSSAVLPSGSVFMELGSFRHFWSVLSRFFVKSSYYCQYLGPYLYAER